MARGGYREPANPAPVSGPGALSQRTDGGPADTGSQPVRRMPDAAYGESKAFQEQQRGAPVAQSSPTPPDTSSIVPLEEGTQHPDQPVTAGAATPGAPRQPAEEDLMRIRRWLPVLEHVASRPGAMQSTRQFVRQLREHV